MTAQSPRALVLQLDKTTTDDGMIIAHVKREFGVTYDKRDIQRIRSTRSVKLQRATPIALAHTDRVVKIGAEDKLLFNIARYKERTCPAEADHWRLVQHIASGGSYVRAAQ